MAGAVIAERLQERRKRVGNQQQLLTARIPPNEKSLATTQFQSKSCPGGRSSRLNARGVPCFSQ
jgi:hypothetical protein